MGFLQQAWVQKYLPMLSSLALHLMIFLLIVATYQAIKELPPRNITQTAIPDVEMLTENASAVFNKSKQSVTSDETLFEPKVQSHQNPIFEPVLLKDVPRALKGSLTGEELSTMLPLNPDGRIKVPKGTGPIGDPNGREDGKRFGGQGDGTIFSIPGRGGPASGKMAESVIFVCDASGSMREKMDSLIDQINLRIGRMAETQRFNIIFFRDGEPSCLSNVGMLFATDVNKAVAAKFLDGISAHSQTDPIPALKVAFGMQPQLMYLLTDGAFNNEQGVVDFVAKANAAKGVRVMTIAFLEQGDYESVLRSIAEQNKGEFRSVKAGDLQR